MKNITTLVYGSLNKKAPSALDRNQFSSWLTGFIDGEGNFQVFLDRHYLRVVFRINLHIDDIDILYRVKEFLGVGTVIISKNSCVYSIGKVSDLLTVLFPLLDQNKLYTTKWLDYQDFKIVVNYLNTANTTRLSEEQLVWVKNLMQGMNLNRTHYDYSLIPSLSVVDPYWLIGFIEAEGTFGFKNLVPYFQIGQHTRSLMVLNAIALFLQSLPKSFPFTLNSLPPVVANSLNKKTNVSVITVNSIDALYDYLMFFLLAIPLQTRKSLDFLYWCLVLHFHKFGHFYLPEGRAAVNQIVQYANKGRYSNNPDKLSAPDLSNIENILGLTLPVLLKKRNLNRITELSFFK